jgi:hypothetical protein
MSDVLFLEKERLRWAKRWENKSYRQYNALKCKKYYEDHKEEILIKRKKWYLNKKRLKELLK